jgi:hypothetical protein
MSTALNRRCRRSSKAEEERVERNRKKKAGEEGRIDLSKKNVRVRRMPRCHPRQSIFSSSLDIDPLERRHGPGRQQEKRWSVHLRGLFFPVHRHPVPFATPHARERQG